MDSFALRYPKSPIHVTERLRTEFQDEEQDMQLRRAARQQVRIGDAIPLGPARMNLELASGGGDLPSQASATSQDHDGDVHEASLQQARLSGSCDRAARP